MDVLHSMSIAQLSKSSITPQMPPSLTPTPTSHPRLLNPLVDVTKSMYNGPVFPMKHEVPISITSSYNSPPPVHNSVENNTCRLIEYRGIKVAAFIVESRELICLPQAFELFLKHLVGGLHTVYTKLKRLDVIPIVCNVEQVRILRGLGAIQPGVNRCKLIAPAEFDILYDDCTSSSARPGRPPKRVSSHHEQENIKKSRFDTNMDYAYNPSRLLEMSKATGLPYPGFPGGYPGFPLPGSGMPPLLPPPAIMSLAMANHLGRRAEVTLPAGAAITSAARCPPGNDVIRPSGDVIRAGGDVTHIGGDLYSPGRCAIETNNNHSSTNNNDNEDSPLDLNVPKNDRDSVSSCASDMYSQTGSHHGHQQVDFSIKTTPSTPDYIHRKGVSMDDNKRQNNRSTQNLLLEIERLFKYTCESLRDRDPVQQKDKDEQTIRLTLLLHQETEKRKHLEELMKQKNNDLELLERRLQHQQRENSDLKEVIYQNKTNNHENEEEINIDDDEEQDSQNTPQKNCQVSNPVFSQSLGNTQPSDQTTT